MVSSITFSGSKVDGVKVALAQNGSQQGSTPAQVVSSVNLLVLKAGTTTPVPVEQLTLATSSSWTNGSYARATGSSLASLSPAVRAGDTLVIRVRYVGSSAFHDTDYVVP